MNITPQQFYKQWLRLGPAEATVSHFEVQVHDFTFTAGLLTKDRFRQSFSQGGFYGTGSRWAGQTSRWGRRFKHPVMNHTGLLRSVIDGRQSSENLNRSPLPDVKPPTSV